VKLVAAALLATALLTASGAGGRTASTCCSGTAIGDFDPQWSSEGSRIAFIRHDATGINTGPGTLFTMAADGTDVRRVKSLGEDYQPTFNRERPLLSPDWKRIALIAPSSALKIESVAGDDSHELGNGVISFAWSPTGEGIAFHERDSGGNTTIFVANRDGSGLRSLGSGEAPAWSPDSDRIAFVAPDGKLYVMQADGSRRRLVYDGQGAVIYAPSWSPLGDRIAFFAASSLFIVGTDGTRLDQIPTDYLGSTAPQWSFDGTLIAVEAPNIVSVFRPGSTDRSSFPDRREPSWSPTSNELTASFRGPCQQYGVYRMTVLSASRRLTLDCHIRGTAEPDVLTGTAYRDIITGLAGDDEELGGDGEDRLIGGPGGDTLLGGNLADRLEGGYGADLLIGGSFDRDPSTQVDDSLSGGPGPDDLRGGPGPDLLRGDTGNDVLRGGPDVDVLFGGPGNDRIFASGDLQDEHGRLVRDIVSCGSGRHDVAFVDRQDRASGCETVHRR
jgi:hypothetical protein